MNKEVFVTYFERGLTKLRSEVEAFESDGDLWKVHGEVTNSAGNLTLHLIGNLNHFIGAVIGENGYTRDRELEFTKKDVSRESLLADIDMTLETVTNTLRKLEDGDLDKEFPTEVFGGPESFRFMLTHLLTHLNYHLGQINYFRRLI